MSVDALLSFARLAASAYKRLNVVIDEKSPTYAPPTFARVQPADLVAVGDE